MSGLSPFTILFIFNTVVPALLACYLAKKQSQSILVSGFVTFALGFTFIGGWIYLGLMNIFKPKTT